MAFIFDSKKNEKLIRERGVSFSNAIEAIAERGILLEIEHPNSAKFPNQKLIVIEINQYPYCIPIEQKGDVVEMKTIFPDRRFKFLLENEHEKE